MFLIFQIRGVWLKLNLTCFFAEPIVTESVNQFSLGWPWICFRYSLLKNAGSLVVKLSSIHPGSRSNQFCYIEYCPLNWYVSLFYLYPHPFFNLRLLHLDASCLCLWQNSVLIIVILNLIIHRTLIFISVFFNQIFFSEFGIQNRTLDHHNLWI